MAAPAPSPGVGAPARVRVPTGGSDRPPGDEQPRPFDQPLVHGRLQSPIRAPGIADRREPPLEHRLQRHHRARRHQRERDVLELPDEHLAQDDVGVAVDEPRHQRPATAIHDSRVARPDGPLRDFADGLALDQDLAAADQLVPIGVEHPEVPEQGLGHLPPLG